MQGPTPISTNHAASSAAVPNAVPSVTASPSEEMSSQSAVPAATEPSASKLDQSLTALRETLEEHKGKLAIGAAATLGLMVYYNWRERQLAEEEPQEYERLQRIKERVRHADDNRSALDEPRPT